MKNIKIMIVDDESVSRYGVVNVINWQKFNIEIVGEAENGMEAYLKAQELMPNIIITDIRMPIMDGLELIRKVKAELPFIKFIIISGYQDFEYAKQAISLGVEEYLIKPLDEKELIDMVLKVSRKIEEERKIRIEKNFDYIILKQNIPFINRYQELEGKMIEKFKELNETAVENLIDEIYGLFDKSGKEEYYKEICIKQFVSLCLAVDEMGLRNELSEMDSILDNVLFQIDNATEIKMWQKQKTIEFINMIKVAKSSKFKKMLVDIEQFVKNNYQYEITLKDVASVVYISPQYLSKIFRKEKGMPFVEWLNEYRIEKAKIMLISDDIKITNVANLVGYNDYKYFSSVFKKYTGLSPRDYRKNKISIPSGTVDIYENND